jgi:MFS family permease
MFLSVIVFFFSGASAPLYIVVAVLFGIGYGVPYPILVAVTANDAHEDLSAQTLQVFALTYFVGIFGFPLIAGWMIVEVGTGALLVFIAVLALIEATLALRRSMA